MKILKHQPGVCAQLCRSELQYYLKINTCSTVETSWAAFPYILLWSSQTFLQFSKWSWKIVLQGFRRSFKVLWILAASSLIFILVLVLDHESSKHMLSSHHCHTIQSELFIISLTHGRPESLKICHHIA